MCVSPDLNVQILTMTVKGRLIFLPSVMDDETESEPATEIRQLMVRMKLGCKVSPCFHAMS